MRVILVIAILGSIAAFFIFQGKSDLVFKQEAPSVEEIQKCKNFYEETKSARIYQGLSAEVTYSPLVESCLVYRTYVEEYPEASPAVSRLVEEIENLNLKRVLASYTLEMNGPVKTSKHCESVYTTFRYLNSDGNEEVKETCREKNFSGKWVELVHKYGFD